MPEDRLEKRPYPEEDSGGSREPLAFLWRGFAVMGLVAAGALVVFSIVLIAFAQVLPAVLAFVAGIAVALVAGPVLWVKSSENRGQLERRGH